MILPGDLAALERGGCCTRATAFEKGCALCVPRYEAIDRIEKRLCDAETAANERQAIIEVYGKALADIMPDFRAKGPPTEHAHKAVQALHDYIATLKAEAKSWERAYDQATYGHDF